MFGGVDTPYFLFHFDIASIESIRVRGTIGMDRRLRLAVLLLLLLLANLILKFFPEEEEEEKVSLKENTQRSESFVIQTEERHSRNVEHSVAKEKGEIYGGTPNHA